MPVLAVEDVVEDAESGDEGTSLDLKLNESVVIEQGAVQDDGSVVLDLIRPCVGRGRGKHLYTAAMLEANAGKFTGWKMYLNHLSDAARRALGGLPRDVHDVGGIVTESYWDPDVPAEGRFGKGAVRGKVAPVALVQELLKVDPRLVEASINATATAVKPGKVGDERVWIVEGIEDRGSVDWVTEAGAGGRVAQIMEALIDDGTAMRGVLEALDDTALASWIAKNRPELAEAMKGKGADDGDEPDEDDVKSFMDKGMPRAAATKAARKAKAKKKVEESNGKGDGAPNLTPEDLAEAFASDEGQAAIAGAVATAIKGLNLGAEVVSLVEARMDADREVFQREARAAADRSGELRDLREAAHRKIAESKLHDALKEQVRGQFDLVEGVPTSALNLISDQDETGKVTKSSREKIDEAVNAAIADGLRLQAALDPTRVRGQGPRLVEAAKDDEPGKGDGGKGDGKGDGGEKPDYVGPATRSLLESVGIKDADAAYEHGRKMAEAAGGA